MNRALSYCPHSCGGEPAISDIKTLQSANCPHSCGGEPPIGIISKPFSQIVPTHVGVNREPRTSRATNSNCPHSCGGEPLTIACLIPLTADCPHSCGGEPSLTRQHELLNLHCPHSCGGEPPENNGELIEIALSPLMWG